MLNQQKCEKDGNPIKRHYYPKFVRLFGFLIIILFFLSILFSQKYFLAFKYFSEGEENFKSGQYNQAIILFKKVLSIVPTSRKTCIFIAKSYFLNTDKTDDENGLIYLIDIDIHENELKELLKIIPPELLKYNFKIL